jgi:hypothetical protein
VASPQQLMGPEFREDCVIIQDGLTIRARMFKPYFADEDLQDWVVEQKSKLGEEIHRAPRPEPTPVMDPAPEDKEPEAEAPVTALPEDADLQGDAEYQAELAAPQARMRGRKAGAPEATKNTNEGDGGAPERPAGSSEPPRRPPTPPSFDE